MFAEQAQRRLRFEADLIFLSEGRKLKMTGNPEVGGSKRRPVLTMRALPFHSDSVNGYWPHNRSTLSALDYSVGHAQEQRAVSVTVDCRASEVR